MQNWQEAVRVALAEQDASRFAALDVCQVASIDSTNSELMRQGRAGHTQPQILWALSQSAGRGRLGREWLSAAPSGQAQPQGLYFSMGLMLAPQDWTGLSLAIGLAIAQTLHPSVGVKWPNDLCVRQGAAYAKLGGILIETAAPPHTPESAARWVVIGLGLNLRQAPQNADLRTPAADIASALPLDAAENLLVDAGLLCARLSVAMVQAALCFEQRGFAGFAADYEARDVLYGLSIHTSAGASGIARGVDQQGNYQIQIPSGELLCINSAEISLRPGAL